MTGKWSRPDIPHRGWLVVGEADLGAYGLHTCAMCESQKPRYIYKMQHPQHAEVLSVGRDCGDVMSILPTGDAAQDRRKPQEKLRPSPLAMLVAARLGEENLLRALKLQTKLSVFDAINLATRIQSQQSHVVLEPFAGIVNFRDPRLEHQIRQATKDQLTLLLGCGILTGNQAKRVQSILTRPTSRDISEQHPAKRVAWTIEDLEAARRVEEEKRLLSLQVRKVCEEVYRRRVADGAQAHTITAICRCVCWAAERNFWLDKQQVEVFAREAYKARVEIAPIRDFLEKLVHESAARRLALGIIASPRGDGMLR